MTEATFHHQHTTELVVGDMSARARALPRFDREWRDVLIVVAGAVFMALCGAGLATYLALPFNS